MQATTCGLSQRVRDLVHRYTQSRQVPNLPHDGGRNAGYGVPFGRSIASCADGADRVGRFAKAVRQVPRENCRATGLYAADRGRQPRAWAGLHCMQGLQPSEWAISALRFSRVDLPAPRHITAYGKSCSSSLGVRRALSPRISEGVRYSYTRSLNHLLCKPHSISRAAAPVTAGRLRRGCSDQTVRTVEPVVLRAIRSACALAASLSG